jgi:hypothetical protein
MLTGAIAGAAPEAASSSQFQTAILLRCGSAKWLLRLNVAISAFGRKTVSTLAAASHCGCPLPSASFRRKGFASGHFGCV